MSHHSEGFTKTPSLLTVSAADRKKLGNKTDLIVRGQGTLLFHLSKGAKEFWVDMVGEEDTMRFTLGADGARLYENGELVMHSHGARLDPEPKAPYWLSFDAGNGWFKYGIGEVRDSLTQEHFILFRDWVYKVKRFEFPDEVRVDELYRDPVTVDPPPKVKDTNEITIDDVAHNLYTVPANLTPTCRKLYQNVGGRNFTLNTPDFPDFAAAIEHSIRTPGCWCHTKLEEKSTEFGKPDLLATYLRITLGQNQGESPGIPYVVEIWPPGHFSPIHNHAGAHAVIRVLYGEIHVDLYPMLSDVHRHDPYASVDFKEGDVAWITPRYHQVHRLTNTNPNNVTCITIQCYLYGEGDNQHYRYFDYLEDSDDKDIHKFDPNSDMDFVDFKVKIKEEWDAFLASGTGKQVKDV